MHSLCFFISHVTLSHPGTIQKLLKKKKVCISNHMLLWVNLETSTGVSFKDIKQAYIIKVAKLSSSSQVDSKFKRTP